MKTNMKTTESEISKQHPKHGKTCKCCGHLIVWIKYKGYKCFCDQCKTI